MDTQIWTSIPNPSLVFFPPAN
uniref:Uncharacterized protein n=1 Tax=Anguilla anguilla TaxID=7936 RepID=A0A0E9UAP1_ANGAN